MLSKSTSSRCVQQRQQVSSRPGRVVLTTNAIRCQSSAAEASTVSGRRDVLLNSALMTLAVALAPKAAMAIDVDPPKVLCTPECEAALEAKDLITLPSGLQYKDLVEGTGPSPPVGFQVVVNYDARTPKGRVFDSSLEKGKPYDIRVGGGQVIPGLDEGLQSMKTGGIRRLYIPGELAFPKGLKAAAGRPSVPPSSPVIFDVQLLYIPGLEVDE